MSASPTASRATTRRSSIIVALGTVIGWLLVGGGWHMALTTAVAVLIITCPCALGLAVPAVQVVAGGFLLGRGIMVKDGGALERLAAIDTVVFDKTGTLTEGEPRLAGAPAADAGGVVARGGAGRPRAAIRWPAPWPAPPAPRPRASRPSTTSSSTPATAWRRGSAGAIVRLGRRDFVGGVDRSRRSAESEIWLRIGDKPPLRFGFEDTLRPDAAETIAALKAAGLDVILLSGDRPEAVARVAELAGIRQWRAGQRPAEKTAFLAELAANGRRVLMVGDGLNDAPALASAFVSMSPANAADISQAAADIVFTGRMLAPVAARPRRRPPCPPHHPAEFRAGASATTSSPSRSPSSASPRR